MNMNISVNEQNSIRIETDAVVYIDPFNIKEISGDADIIFVTHSHYDHFDPDSILKIVKEDTVIVMPSSMADDYEKSSIGNECFYVEPGMAYEIYGLVFETVRAYNTNKDFHKKEYDWVGYILNMDGKRIYICGDTDITEEAKAVKCDILMLPIGGTYTIDAKEAADLTGIIKPQTVIPTHYGTEVGMPEDIEVFKRFMGTDSVIVEKIHF